MGSVCGGMAPGAAATEIMKTPWSSSKRFLSRLAIVLRLPAGAREQVCARVAVHHLRELLDGLLLLLRERLRDLDVEAVVDVAATAPGELLRALATQALHASLARAGGNADLLGAA